MNTLVDNSIDLIWAFGECFQQEVQMSKIQNFIDVPTAVILGEITHKV
jgi:hypothetical protein